MMGGNSCSGRAEQLLVRSLDRSGYTEDAIVAVELRMPDARAMPGYAPSAASPSHSVP